MIYKALYLALISVLSTVYGSPVARDPGKGPDLYACANTLSYSDGTVTALAVGIAYSPFLECRYASGVYCFYDYTSHTLLHVPNTPRPTAIDSDPACPPITPFAQTYLIRSSVDGSKCVTKSGDDDGAPLVIRTCNSRRNYAGQKWFFDGTNLVASGTNKCIDVKDGVVDNGVKLQTWTCVGGNTNQQFEHWGDVRFLGYPEDHIQWRPNAWLAMDLTDGNVTDENILQMWMFDYVNPNQHWVLTEV